MDYKLLRMPRFSIIGQETKITSSHAQNFEICRRFWHAFNTRLKKEHLSQHGHWVKYAFMYKHGNDYMYCCGIPGQQPVPAGFIQKDIGAQQYAVFQHVGRMDSIYATYNTIYRTALPASGCTPNRDSFLHFEKYDHRFHWSRADSIIEIWVPVI